MISSFRHDDPAEREHAVVPLAMLPGVLAKHVEAIKCARDLGTINEYEASALRAEARRTTLELPIYTLEDVAAGRVR